MKRTLFVVITDGSIDSRVAKYDRSGDWMKSSGEKGTGPGQFRLPHSIGVDRQTTCTSAIVRTGATTSSAAARE
jgi:hypothetical protein